MSRWRSILARRVPALLVLIALGCDADGSASDARSPDSQGDAAAVDGGLADARVPPACVDDRFGTGTPDFPATTLGAEQTTDLVICPPAIDWFALELPIGRPFAVRVEANRDVRLQFGDARAEGRRPVLRGVVPPSGVVIGIEAVDAAAVVRYTLSAATSVSECADAHEPDDTPADARALDENAEGVVCERDVDLFRVSGAPGDRVRFEAVAVEGQGVTVAAVADFDGRAVPIEAADRSITRRLNADGAALFAVYPLESGGRYRASVGRAPIGGGAVERSGAIQVPDRAVTADGLQPPVHAPVAGLIVDALVDGELAAVARTDARGEWTLAFVAPPDAEVTVRARASIWDAGRLITVGPTPAQAWADEVDAVSDLAADSAIGRAAHIAATLAQGMQALAPYLPLVRQPPPIHARWTPGGSVPCGTCYQPGPDRIELSGRPTDPDEWDDAIILHELAHHVAARYGRDDSPGGAHDGSPVAPALAWSEGFATATAAWLSGPIVFDSRATGVRQLDLEVMDDPRAFGTVNDQPDGAVSEYLVAAILWDLLDSPMDDDDAECVSPDVFFEAALSGLVLRAIDVGAPGADLLDHAEELACRAPIDWATLLESRDISAPVVCRNKPGSMLAQVGDDLQARCAGWLTKGATHRWIEVDDRVDAQQAVRLECLGFIEYFDPPGASTAATPRWRIIAGAAEISR